MLSIALLALVVSQGPSPAPAPSDAAPAPAPAGPADAVAPPPAAAPATTALPPPTKPRLLVLDLVDKGAGAEVTGAVNQAVQGQAVQSHLGETVTATQIKIAIDAAANQALIGCESEACMTDIGKTVEAAIILGGSAAKVGDDFLITLTAVNARDGSRLGQAQRKVPGNRELYYYAARQLTSIVLTGRSADPRVPVVISIATGEQAVIIVDGKEVGAVRETTVQLDPGSHEIRVRAPGKAEWKSIVTIEEATPQKVTASLVDDRLDLWPAAIVTGVVSVVALAGAGYFGYTAQSQYDGTGILAGPDAVPNSYIHKEPVDSQELFTLEQQVEQNALYANIAFGTAAVLGAAAVGLVATELILDAVSE